MISSEDWHLPDTYWVEHHTEGRITFRLAQRPIEHSDPEWSLVMNGSQSGTRSTLVCNLQLPDFFKSACSEVWHIGFCVAANAPAILGEHNIGNLHSGHWYTTTGRLIRATAWIGILGTRQNSPLGNYRNEPATAAVDER